MVKQQKTKYEKPVIKIVDFDFNEAVCSVTQLSNIRVDEGNYYNQGEFLQRGGTQWSDATDNPFE